MKESQSRPAIRTANGHTLRRAATICHNPGVQRGTIRREARPCRKNYLSRWTNRLALDCLDSELSVFMQRLRVQGVAGEPGLV
jgi:hypothetical protein